MSETTIANRILNKLEEIRVLIEEQNRNNEDQKWFKDKNFLLCIPDHLRITVLALHKLNGEAYASQISEITKRARAVESGYLNQLCLMKILKKKRKGRRAYFSLFENKSLNSSLEFLE